MKYTDRICILTRTQRNLKELDDIVKEKELVVQKTRLVFKRTCSFRVNHRQILGRCICYQYENL